MSTKVERFSHHPPKRAAALATATTIALLALMTLIGAFYQTESAESAAGDLTVRIVTADNLVVDSNALSPSTYAPSVATIMAEICNTTVNPINNVQAFIGDYDSGIPANSTPGIYPFRSKADILSEHATLHSDTPDGTGYSFTHVGGTAGTRDATRLLGTLAGNSCVYQYWHFTYPRLSNGTVSNDNGGTETVYGTDVKHENDLWLEFDVWATNGTPTDNAADTHRMYMRNEISAMANKIRPNPDGFWFNTDTSVVKVGQPITSNGILYTLGNINQGFDNDGDLVPDYNAWMQPIGDPAYDPSCFRLIRTTGVLTVSRSGGNPDLIIDFDDTGSYVGGVIQPQYAGPLYFTNLPSNNNGVRGKVFYTFVPMLANCTTALSPYQEVASGSDNEKFNGDFGTGIAALQSEPPSVTFTKTAPVSTINEGVTLSSYSITISNVAGSDPFGLSLTVGTGTATAYGVIEDTVPEGVQYASASPAAFSSTQTGLTATIFFSTDGGSTWSTNPLTGSPTSTAANPIVIQWRLNGVLAVGESATGTFDATVPVGYAAGGGNPLIENCADLSIDGGPSFAESCDSTLVNGAYTIGNFVWRDLNNDGQQDGGLETGIDNVTVNLYFDANGDGILDATDPLVKTATTASGGAYTFSLLPAADYIVAVDTDSAGIPAGYKETTAVAVSVLDLGTSPNTSPFVDADFGFGPSLTLDKQLPSPNPIFEGDSVTYDIILTNNRPGTGGAGGSCVYEGYAQVLDTDYTVTSPAGAAWQPYTNVPGDPDTNYADSEFASNNEIVAVHTMALGAPAGSPTALTILLAMDIAPDLEVFRDTDEFEVQVVHNNGTVGNTADDTVIFDTTDTATFPLATPITGIVLNTLDQNPMVYEIPVPAEYVTGFSVADLVNGNISIVVTADGAGGSYNAIVRLDAAGVRVENGLTCDDPSDVIQPLPLSDTYDSDYLEFVSASPAPTTLDESTPTGTITWNDVGPLDPGETFTVTVTYKALEPFNNAQQTDTSNCADSAGGLFPDNSPTNDPAQDCVDVTHNPTAIIGDRVWVNNVVEDEKVDGGEQGLPNVRVWLCPQGACNATTAIITTTTNVTGTYQFEGVVDGDYTVAIDTSTLPSGAVANYDVDGIGTPHQSNLTIASAADNLLQDFGYIIDYALFGNVWEDVDGDGSQESGEGGIDGVTVELYNCGPDATCGNADDVLVTSQSTSGGGDYLFDGLTVAISYYTVVTSTNFTGGGALVDYGQTVDPDEGGICATCNNQMNAPGGAETMTGNPLIRGSFDYAYQASGSLELGNFIYRDWDGDGNVDPEEDGIDAVTVWLYEDEDNDGIVDVGVDALISTTVTVNGVYTFSNLVDGSYIVMVDESGLPSGYSQTDDPDEDSGVCATCDGSGATPDISGANDDTYDFGYRPTGAGTIGDLVWVDGNADGAYQDSFEVGLANIQVCLYHDLVTGGAYDSGTDALIECVDTDASGLYEFDNLPLGEDYLVIVNSSDSDLPTRGGQPYALSTAGTFAVPDLGTPSNSFLTADFGFFPAGIIGDYVWADYDYDGNQDAGEPGLRNVTVELYDCGADNDCTTLGDNNLLSTDVTDNDGNYLFSGLAPDDYLVQVVTATLPITMTTTQSSDPDETGVCSTCDDRSILDDPTTGVPGLQSGSIDRSRDFGYVPISRLGDTVWIDTDGDGFKDDFEKGIAGITVNLYDAGDDNLCGGIGVNADTLVTSTETDDQGEYAFGGLDANNSYCVVVDTGDTDWPTTVSTTPTTDPDGVFDSQTAATYVSGTATDVGGSCASPCEFDADFGYPLSGTNTISGTVFYDGGNDGGLYAGTPADAPFIDITVRLFTCANPPTCSVAGSFVGALQTDANGFYSFGNLPDGDYIIAVDDKTSTVSSYSQTREPGFDCGGCDNRHAVTGLTGGATDDLNDFGYYGSQGSPTAIRLAATMQKANPLPTLFAVALGFLLLASLLLWRRRQPLAIRRR